MYVCPGCGKNNRIMQAVPVWVDYAGRFDEDCVFKDDLDEDPALGDLVSCAVPYYYCCDCEETFSDPIRSEEFLERQKAQ